MAGVNMTPKIIQLSTAVRSGFYSKNNTALTCTMEPGFNFGALHA
jgi:hypothetical protein